MFGFFLALIVIAPCELVAQESGLLTFRPAAPRAAEEIQVEYRAMPELAERSRLHLRVRFRTAADEMYNNGMTHEVAAVLRKSEGGAYRGSFTLPDSMVFAAFAVEDPQGRIVDHNERRLWEILVHGPGGVPSYEALEQRANDLMGRNWEEAHRTAERLVDLYPDRPSAWGLLRFFQKQVLGPEPMERALEDHHARFRAFDDTLSRHESVPSSVIGTMMWYARAIGDTAGVRRWQERLLREAPAHTFALQEQIIFEILPELRGDDRALLEALDSVWSGVEPYEGEGGPGYGQLVHYGLEAALGTGDQEAIRRWSARHLRVYPSADVSVARRTMSHPAFRDEAIETIRSEIERLEGTPDQDRRLVRTRDEHRIAGRRPLQRMLIALAEGLEAAGDRDGANRARDRAADAAWDTEIFRRTADAALSSGDTVRALELWARVAVDPGTEPSYADSVEAMVGPGWNPADWRELTREANRAMEGQVLVRAVTRELPGAIHLPGAGGGTMIGSGQEAAPLFVAFWSRFCGAALAAADELERTIERLEQQGIRTIVVVDEAPAADLAAFLAERDLSFPLRHDLDHEASRAFNQWGTPTYFLMDAEGRIRFEYSELSDILRQAEVLRRMPG